MADPSLLIVQQYAIPPDQAGGTRHFEMAQNLERSRWNVRILASDFSHPERRFVRRTPLQRRKTITIDEGGVRFSYAWIPPYSGNGRDRIFSMFWFSAAALWQSLRGTESVVMGSSPHIFGALGAYIGAKFRRRKFVFEVRDLWPESYEAVQPGAKASLQYRLISVIANHLYRHSDLVVILAEGNRETVISRGASRERVICVPNGVDLSTFSAVSPSPHHGPLRFVYTGAHGEANGLDVLIDAAKELEARGQNNFSITLVGDGPQKARLIQRVSTENVRNVSFRDPVPKDAMPGLLAQFDVGLMILRPADLFSFGVSPNKLYDYFAANLPIASNVPGAVAEIVATAGGGATSVTPDVLGVSALLDEFIARGASDLRATYGGGRAHVVENVDRGALADRLRRALDELVNR